jgi:hypothetical protein
MKGSGTIYPNAVPQTYATTNRKGRDADIFGRLSK